MKLNIELIDLRQFNHIKLQEMCEKNGFDYQMTLQCKDGGIAKVWVDTNTNDIIAYTTKKNPEVIIGSAFIKMLNEIDAMPLIKKERVLNVDYLLEKISKYGISSLKKDEKDFLDNLNK